MTEKRFTETLSTGIVTDHVSGKEYKCEMRIDDELLELLNKLADENEQLKSDNQEWRKSSQYWSKQHTELEKENEQLKSENRQLKGRLMEYEEQIKR